MKTETTRMRGSASASTITALAAGMPPVMLLLLTILGTHIFLNISHIHNLLFQETDASVIAKAFTDLNLMTHAARYKFLLFGMMSVFLSTTCGIMLHLSIRRRLKEIVEGIADCSSDTANVPTATRERLDKLREKAESMLLGRHRKPARDSVFSGAAAAKSDSSDR